MKLTQAIFLLSAMFLSACTDIKESEHASTLLAMHQKYFDYQNQDTSPETPHPNRSEVSIPQFEIQLLNADHTPAASADYQIRQYNSLGFSVPGTPLKTDFGATNETGYIQVNRTDKGLFAALYLSGNGLPFYFAQPLSLRGFDSDLIKITIPEKRIYSGRVAPSFSGESQPVQVWAWQNSEFTRIPLLPLLPAKYLLHCDELELLQDAEFVSDIRNSTDLRVEEPSYFELSLGENNEYTFTGTAQEPTICVLDNQGRFQWFKLDPESTRTQIFTLRDPSEHVIKIVDEFGEPAVGAFVATASGIQ